jgi:hypothetical protein
VREVIVSRVPSGGTLRSSCDFAISFNSCCIASKLFSMSGVFTLSLRLFSSSRSPKEKSDTEGLPIPRKRPLSDRVQLGFRLLMAGDALTSLTTDSGLLCRMWSLPSSIPGMWCDDCSVRRILRCSGDMKLLKLKSSAGYARTRATGWGIGSADSRM